MQNKWHNFTSTAIDIIGKQDFKQFTLQIMWHADICANHSKNVVRYQQISVSCDAKKDLWLSMAINP